MLWEGSEPTSVAPGEQPAFAANPESETGQGDPNARGQSDANVTQKDPKFNRARIAEVRQRLKAASIKPQKATSPGGLSVSEVRDAIELLQLPGFKQIKLAQTQNDLPKPALDRLKSVAAGGVRGGYLPGTDEI